MTQKRGLVKWLLSSYWVIFICILVVAACIRFFKLGEVPHGMAWDEAAIGYNGYAIFTTRRDEWLVKLPLSFRSFGDYKSPLAIYLNGPFTYFLGMQLWVVRLPFAIAGVLSVAGFMLLVRLLKEKLKLAHADQWSLLGGALLCLSPWHIHFSRVAFESGLALFFLIWGVYFFFQFLFFEFKDIRNKKKAYALSITWAILSAIFLSATVYTYHSAKVVIPLMVIALGVMNWRRIIANLIPALVGCGVGAAALWPLAKDLLWGNGNERLNQASIFSLSGSFFQFLQTFVNHFLQHFTPQFLILGQTLTLRHGDGKWGVLFPTTFALVLIAIIMFFLKKKRMNLAFLHQEYLLLLGIVWIIIGIVPAALGLDVPHSNRALLALPGFLLVALEGMNSLIQYLSKQKLNNLLSGTKAERNLLVKSVLGCIVLLHALFAMNYLYSYFTEFSKTSATDFSDGYLEAMQIAKKYEPTVDKILFTDTYGQPYIYALFVRRTNPIWYQGGSLVKYEFTSKIQAGDLSRPNTLIIASPDDIDPKLGQQVIYGQDGRARFVVIKTE
jgi:4-amino-4-deoxy-L-arabinose transferase-like glycosyltransferase